jgi:hypothetical protein
MGPAAVGNREKFGTFAGLNRAGLQQQQQQQPPLQRLQQFPDFSSSKMLHSPSGAGFPSPPVPSRMSGMPGCSGRGNGNPT